MSSPDPSTDLAEAPPEELQRVLAAAIKAYTARVEAGERLSPLPPAGDPLEVSATEVLVAVTDMLAACEIELFELGMWQTWGGVRVG
jgi:hypothetical protein